MKTNSSKQIFIKLLTSEFFILIMSAVYYVIIGIISPKMFSVNMINNIFQNMWPLLAICLGQTFVLLLGGIDLSQTSVISFCSIVVGILLGGEFQKIKFGQSPLWGNLLQVGTSRLDRNSFCCNYCVDYWRCHWGDKRSIYCKIEYAAVYDNFDFTDVVGCNCIVACMFSELYRFKRKFQFSWQRKISRIYIHAVSYCNRIVDYKRMDFVKNGIWKMDLLCGGQ